MEKCPNHPEKEAVYACHSCGKHFCESCLKEAGDYYYCSNPECQKAMKAAMMSEPLP